MLQLEYPWLLTVLPLPLLVWWLLPSYRERQEAVRIPFFDQIAEATGLRPSAGAVVLRRNLLQWVLAPLMWFCVVAALVRPVWVEPPIERIESARDLLLGVDLSGSMDTRDMRGADGRPEQRLAAVKTVLDDFISRREGDRIGLLVFGSAAYVQAPFTLDHSLTRDLLAEMEVRMAGPQTVLGDGIGLAMKVFEESAAEQRVLVLLTDGNDTGSSVPPEKAAQIAAGQDITIYTIGFGNPDATGENLFDEAVLEAVAEVTGGVSLMAGDVEGLEAAYIRLDELEPMTVETISYRPTRPLYQWPLGAAMLIVLLYNTLMLLATGVRAIRRGARRHA